MREDKERLKGELQDCLSGLQALVNNNAALTAYVATLQCLSQDDFSREVIIDDTREQVVADFQRFDAHVALLTTKHKVGYDASYERGVEEIFFNIQRKRQNVDYRFLGQSSQALRIGGLKKRSRVFSTLSHHLHPHILRLRMLVLLLRMHPSSLPRLRLWSKLLLVLKKRRSLLILHQSQTNPPWLQTRLRLALWLGLL